MDAFFNVPRISNARLYLLISSLETDLRTFLRKYVFEQITEVRALGLEFESANKLRIKDGYEYESIELYLNLNVLYETLSRNSNYLPRIISDEINKIAVNSSLLMKVRNRISHSRPLSPEDIDSFWLFVRTLNFETMNETNNTYTQLVNNEFWEPDSDGFTVDYDVVLNNLPSAEYEETGLIGRDEEIEQLHSLISHGRNRMITIVGEGGLGKTAIALEIAYKFAEENSGFDAIIWTSLKTEKLTANGIKEIANSIVSIEGVNDALEVFFEDNFDSDVNNLAEILEGLKVLLIIDNIETIDGAEIVKLYDSLPESTYFLLTSRTGVGNVERRFPLEPLKQKSSTHLLRKFAESRKVKSLSTISNDDVISIVNRLRNSPLAIRWFVQSVEFGSSISDLLNNQDQLLEFCVGDVVEKLSPPARRVVSILRVLSRPISFEYLAMFEEELTVDSLRLSLQELTRSSVISGFSSTTETISQLFQLTPSIEKFIPKVDSDYEFSAQISKVDRDFRISEEKRQNSENKGGWSPAIIRVRSENDKALAHKLNLAYANSINGNFELALQICDRADSVDSTYWEIERMRAHIYSESGNHHKAVIHGEIALSKAPDDVKAIASYFCSLYYVLARDDYSALRMAMSAYNDSDKNPIAAFQVSKVLMYQNEFEQSDKWLKEAEVYAESDDLRSIASLHRIHFLHRWSEYALLNRNSVVAINKALEGINLGVSRFSNVFLELKLDQNLADCFVDLFNALILFDTQKEEFLNDLSVVFKNVPNLSTRLKKTKHWYRASKQLFKLHAQWNSPNLFPQELLELISPDDSREKLDALSSENRYFGGSIHSLKIGYGFIQHEDFPYNVFFPFSVLSSTTLSQNLYVGQTVIFDAPIHIVDLNRAAATHVFIVNQ